MSTVQAQYPKIGAIFLFRTFPSCTFIFWEQLLSLPPPACLPVWRCPVELAPLKQLFVKGHAEVPLREAGFSINSKVRSTVTCSLRRLFQPSAMDGMGWDGLSLTLAPVQGAMCEQARRDSAVLGAASPPYNQPPDLYWP